MSARRTRRLTWLALAAFVLLLCAPALHAVAAEDEDPQPKAEAEEPADGAGGLSARDLEKRLMADPSTLVTILLVRFLPIGVGLGLLIAWYIKRDKIRAGVLPAPEKAVLSLPFEAGHAYLLMACAMFIVPSVVVLLGSGGSPPSLGLSIAASALGTVPVAAVVLLRRQRLRLVAADAPVPVPEAPTSPPGLARAFGLGWWTFCVAAVAVVPLGVVWALTLAALGQEPQVQDLVLKVVDPAATYEPWLILVFGVLVAPFVEECLFRGMLYPATRRAFGGGRRGAWRAALLVSLLFAAVHLNWLAFVPLFALALVLTWIFERTNSLAACIFAHAIHNGLSLIPLLLLRAS